MFKFAAIDSIAHIVTGAVGDISDKIVVGAIGATEETVDGADKDLDDIDIFPFVEATDVICFGDSTAVENSVDSAGVVDDIEPVANVVALTIDRERLTMTYIIDEQRYKFFWKLIGAVVVGAVGDDSGQAISVVECAHEMVAGSLRSAVRAVRHIFKVLGKEVVAIDLMGREVAGEAFGVRKLESAIDLVGTDMIEAFALEFFGARLPIEFSSLQHRECTHHIGTCEGKRVLDRAVDMAFGSEMDNTIDVSLRHQSENSVEVAHIGFDERIVRLILDVLKVSEVAGIGKFIDVDDVIIGILIDKKSNDMGADETGTASNDNIHRAKRLLNIHYISDTTLEAIGPIGDREGESRFDFSFIEDGEVGTRDGAWELGGVAGLDIAGEMAREPSDHFGEIEPAADTLVREMVEARMMQIGL